MHDDICTGGVLLALGHSIAVGPVRLPHPGLLAPPGAGDNGDLVGHHEGRVKAHAELADNVDLVRGLVVFGQSGLELAGAAAGDGAQVGFQILLGHPDAVVRNGQGAHLLVRDDGNLQVLPLYFYCVVSQRFVSQLVLGVAGVGDQLPEKDLLMGIDGVDHQVQQPLGFGLKLLLCHDFLPPYMKNFLKTKWLALVISEC